MWRTKRNPHPKSGIISGGAGLSTLWKPISLIFHNLVELLYEFLKDSKEF